MSQPANLKPLYYSAIAWTVIGLLGGLFYREFTRGAEVAARSTQLSLVHTHSLTLGVIFSLLVLALVRNLQVSRKLFTAYLWFWNIGVALTTSMLLTKGILQVLGKAFADSPMLAGIAGLGHICLSVGFVLILICLRPLATPVTAETR